MRVTKQNTGDIAGHARTMKLRRLYTEHVFPDKMLALWNDGIDRLSHVVRASEDPVEQRPRLVNEFVQCIVTQLMHVDSCPTLSRFFT